MKINTFQNKNLVILGIGQEGLDTFNFLRKKFPNKLIAIADQKSIFELDRSIEKIIAEAPYLKYYGGKNYLDSLKNFDVIIKSPGIQYEKIKKYLKKDAIITSQTELFFENCPANIIGVTGTKGKSTTSSLIYHILKKNGYSAYLLGNIEIPALSYLDKIKKTDWVVYELSSHQLQFLKISPTIAVFLNIYPEHLDYYKNFKEYFNAKANIALFQKKSDYFIYNPKFPLIKNLAKKVSSKKIPIDSQRYIQFFNKYPKLKTITHSDNLSAVFEIANIFKINQANILRALKSFKPLEHRLEYVGQFQGIHFYDDSIATIPEAAIFALDTLGSDVQTLILGGYDRGIDFKKLSQDLEKRKNLKTLILFPNSGKKIWQGINPKLRQRFNHVFVNNMEKAVKLSYQYTEPYKICLLSCASPSFGLFKNYKERGDLFKKYIREYGKSSIS